VAELHELTSPTADHSHDFVELAVVTGGTATHVSVGGEQRLGRGSLVLMRPGDWHGYRDCRGLTVYNVYFGPELLRRELAWLRTGDCFGRPLTLDDGQLTLAERSLTGLTRQETATVPAVRIGLLLCVLGGAVASAAEEPGAEVHPRVLAAARLLEDDPAGEWSMHALADRVNLSPAHLARLFTRQLGQPPMSYLARLRAEWAAGLLIETNLPVAAIGRRVGWPDPNYAGRRFKQFFGISPARYRARFRPEAQPGGRPVSPIV
jgi:AraC family L-rhamnose operon transcriptional activator RhaR